MPFTVSEEVVRETTYCKYKFRCMSDEVHKMCPVDDFQESSQMLFILSGNGDSCPYHVELSNAVVCVCPVRKELYIRYGI
jgi:hypothetical protein